MVHGAELAVWLLEAEKARGKQEVRRVLLGVWVEMMCYAAHRCTRDSHAKQLNSGGEFITVVWLLSTAMFNRRYCDEDWFKNGVWEFFRPPFHVEEEHKDGCFCVIFYVCVLLPVLPYILYKYKEWSFPQFFRPSRGARPPPPSTGLPQ